MQVYENNNLYEGKIYSRLLIAKAFNWDNRGAEKEIVMLRKCMLCMQYDLEDSTKAQDPYIYELCLVNNEFKTVMSKNFLTDKEASRAFVNLTMHVMPFAKSIVSDPHEYYNPMTIFYSNVKIQIYRELLDEIIENIKRITSLLKKENAVIYTEYGAIRWM